MNNTQVFTISLPNMQAAFERMRTDAGWDTNDKLFWGYYFLDHDHKKVERFGNELKKEGYEIVEVRKTEGDLFLLHAEEHVAHSPESLFQQCHTLAKLATDNNIEVFDGWDVEKTNSNNGLVE
jgi:hypothetical protein